MSYVYRCTDGSEELVTVDFETAMNQQGGYITLPDGREAKRCVYLEEQPEPEYDARISFGPAPEIVSDVMGVTAHQVAEFRQDAAQHGLKVEFVQDPTEPTFYKAKFWSWAEWNTYRQHCGFTDRNSRNGSTATLTAGQFERAKQRVLEAHPTS